MKILLQVVLVVVACAGCAAVVWYEWRQLSPPPPHYVASTAPAAPQAAPAPVERAPTVRFKNVVAGKVEDLVRGAVYQDEETVGANEMALPRAGLPALQEQLDRKDLSETTRQAIKSALDADQPRLQLALKDKKRLDWFLKTMLTAYDTNNPDLSEGRAAGRSAVAAEYREWAEDPGRTGDEQMQMWRYSHGAIEGGSKDAMVFYVHAGNLGTYNQDMSKVVDSAIKAEHLMEQQKYSDYLQMRLALYVAKTIKMRGKTTEADDKEVDRMIQRAKELFPRVISDPDIPQSALVQLFKRIGETSLQVYGNRRAMAAPMFELLQKSKVDPSAVLTVQGVFNFDYAWDARNWGNSGNVTDEQDAQFSQRLSKGEKALEKAWELDHGNCTAAAEIIRMAVGLEWTEKQMEPWFERAVAADPLSENAYSAKLYFLEPKWNGSSEEILSFGRQAARGAPAESPVRLMAVRAHLALAQYWDQKNAVTGSWWGIDERRVWPQYFEKTPGAWEDIHSAYVDYLTMHPESNHARLKYALLAGWCGHWDEADRMYKQVDARWYEPDLFHDPDEENGMRTKAAWRVAHPTTSPATQP